ncbi:homoserine dehydrogenase, partial [Staphylococcus epidermidis]
QLPFHKSLQMVERDDQTVAIIVIGLDQSPENVLNKAGFNVEKIYPVEGV